jgi:high affinity Mn2+ porin
MHRPSQLVSLATCWLLPVILAVTATVPALAQQPDAPSAVKSYPALQTDATAVTDVANSPQQTAQPGTEAGPATTDTTTDLLTMFPHSESSRYWISGQANVVLQFHSSFPAQYNGPNSLTPWAQSATTHILTLYTGYEVTHTTEVFADMEDATGSGIGNALGLAGYTNLDSVRLVEGVPLSKGPYLARLMVRQIIPLTDERVAAERDEFHLATSLPARRIEFRAGKFDLVDFFDSANTRGYTDGAIVEYDDHWFSARFAETLMPKIANGIQLDADIARARAETFELEARGSLIAHRAGVVRLLSYVNQADMGNYQEAIADYLEGETATPSIVSTRRQGRHKYGFELNFEQEIVPNVSAFGRLGWSDGHNESFAFTEDDRTLELGAFSKGNRWHRRNDRAGVAFVANGIVAAHQDYLALGGLGFILGDGGLTYGPEKIFEGFYTAHVWRGIFAAFDLQHVNNPGYNMVRGPITVGTLRLHVDF